MKLKAAHRKALEAVIKRTLAYLIAAIAAYYGYQFVPLENGGEQKPESTQHTTTQNTDVSNLIEGDFSVVRVVDGDTIVVDVFGAERSVRYIGIDTPETKDPRRAVECMGAEAAARNSELVASGIVTLKRDTSPTDKYGRLLRYVSVSHGSTTLDVGETLLAEGFATTLNIPPDTARAATYQKAQATARSTRLGLWSYTCANSSL